MGSLASKDQEVNHIAPFRLKPLFGKWSDVFPEATGIDIHAAERLKFPFMTWADETPAQRLAVHHRRAAQAVIDNPEWDDDKLADEWGITPQLIADARSEDEDEMEQDRDKRQDGDRWDGDPEPSLPARILGAVRDLFRA